MIFNLPAFFRRIENAGFLFLALMCLAGCSQPMLFKETSILMDTFVEISSYSSDKRTVLNAIKDSLKEIERVEKLLSKFNKESELSKINRLAREEDVVVTREVFELIERSIHYSDISGGSFDITVKPQKRGRYKDIILDRDRLSIRFSDTDLEIDLGGIAKGYAVDRAKGVLLSHGIKNALINIGGNIFALGSPPGKDSWQIGIQHPRDKNAIVHRLSLRNRAIATSGDYERPLHIIDPATGNPSEDIMSVTIVAPSAEEADALSTAVFVMGPERGTELLRSIEGAEAYIFDRSANLTE